MKMKHLLKSTIIAVVVMLLNISAHASEETVGKKPVDVSDPTKIHTFLGVGPRYTSYTNDEHMWEGRLVGNMGWKKDMVLFELGYGWHDGDKAPGGNSGLTEGRVRWFHLFQMDYGKVGYRGWASQVDLQFQGGLKGTDGGNTLSWGGVLAFGLAPKWSLFLMGNLAGNWNKDFKRYQGTGFNFSPLLVYKPGDRLWKGAFLRIWPGYTRFFSGDLDGEGGGNLDISIGGNLSPTKVWVLYFSQSFDKDFNSMRNIDDAVLIKDWNIRLTFSTFF